MNPARRTLLALLSAAIAALAAVLALVLPTGSASAAAVPAAGTRVGASHPGMILAVGVPDRVSAVQGRGEAASQPQIVVGACVAAEDAGMIAARSVRFSQDSVSQVFKGGKGSVMQLARDLASGDASPEALPPIRLFQRDGNLYTLDNRRLFAGQMANVSLPYRMAAQAEIDAEINVPVEQGSKFTTPNEGTGIVMRGIGYFSWFGQ